MFFHLAKSLLCAKGQQFKKILFQSIYLIADFIVSLARFIFTEVALYKQKRIIIRNVKTLLLGHRHHADRSTPQFLQAIHHLHPHPIHQHQPSLLISLK